MFKKNAQCLVLFSLLFLFFGLQACSSNKKKKPQITEVFKTHIEQDNTKRFSYRLLVEREKSESRKSRGGSEGKSGKGNSSGGGRGGGKGERGQRNGGRENGGAAPHSDGMESGRENMQSERNNKLLDEGLNKLLDTNKYCRDSYRIDDREASRRTMVIQGHCVDVATDQDRLVFPNEERAPITVLEEDLGALN